MLAQIEEHARSSGLTLERRVLDAVAAVPRHEFVAASLRDEAYDDTPLAIGSGKTISQPFIVALMTDLLAIDPDATVLEIGTGCGYQTAVLCRLARRVCSVELIDELADEARERLARLGVANAEIRAGNGYAGWPEAALFDGILIAAAPETVPPALIAQLKPGGRLVAPVGPPERQELVVVRKGAAGELMTDRVLGVRFSLLDEPP